MKLCQQQMTPVCLLFLALILFAALPAYSQHGSLGIDLGETSDRFGAQPRTTTGEVDIEGQGILFKRVSPAGDPNIVIGGELQLPVDTSTHAPEFAAFVGPEFNLGSHFVLGFHVQVRKIYPPTSDVNQFFFPRYKMLVLEIPAVAEYKFGPGNNAFLRVQASPEFAPHYNQSSSGPSPFPGPTIDHAYTLRGSVGYNFTHWYAKVNYETRYFKFSNNLGNPNNLANWRSDKASAGVGVRF
jgi:hypothetical protein